MFDKNEYLCADSFDKIPAIKSTCVQHIFKEDYIESIARQSDYEIIKVSHPLGDKLRFDSFFTQDCIAAY